MNIQKIKFASKKKDDCPDGGRIRKTVLIFAAVIFGSTLLLIVNSRLQLTKEIVFGGSESAFVSTDSNSDPTTGYSTPGGKGSNSEDALEYPDIDISSWEFLLANSDNSIEKYAPGIELVDGTEDMYFDQNAVASLNKLVAAAQAAGFTPYIGCGYRPYSTQEYLFNAKASQLSWDGTYSEEEAAELAKEIVSYPGTSDHQTGLGADILDAKYTSYNYDEMDHTFYAWMDAHCAEYGFIKRYPENKTDITGWDEPWHYRYVGVTAAKFITDNGLTLEEFIAHYK